MRLSPESATYKLRNVAAEDAAHALRTFLQGKKLTAVVVAEPVSNTLLVSAAPDVRKQLCDILTALDKAPAQVMVQAMVIQVPHGFAARSGLDYATLSAHKAVLSPRETKMFTGLIRGAIEHGECDILSRPQFLLECVETYTSSIW